MVSKDLTFRLFGEDSTASSSLRRLAENADRAASRMTQSMSTSHAGFAGLVGGLVGGVTSGIVSMVGAAVSDVGSMLTTVGGMVATTVIDFNSELQNADIGFTTMLGSGAKAKGFLDDLQAFAKSTPFEFGNLVSNAQQMMGMGIAAKDVIPTLTALGDSVASMGGNAQQVDQVTLAFSQMAAKGTLDMGNMNQLLQGGLPTALKVLASSYGVTTGKMIGMISSGKVMASDALPKLVKGIEQGTKSTAALGGMMDKQSSTFTGALSNIQDGLTQTVSTAFKPFFDAASVGMLKFANALSSKPAKKFTDDVTKILKPFGKEIGDWFKHVDLNKVFSTAGKAIKDIFKNISPKDFGKALKDFGKTAGEVMNDIVRIAPKVIKMMKDVGPAIGDTVKSIVDIVGGIGDMIDWFDKLDKNAHKQTKDFGKVIGDAFKGVIDWFDSLDKNARKQTKDFVDVIKTAAGGVAKWFGDTVKSFQDGWNAIVGFFGRGAHQVVDFFANLPTMLGTIAHQMIDGFVNGITGAWGAVTSTISSLVNAIPAGVRKILGIHSPSRVFHEIGRNVGQGLQNGLLGSKDQIQAASNKLADAVVGMFQSGDISRGAEQAALRTLDSGTTRLEAIAKKRAIVATRLKTAQEALKTVLTDRKDYAAGVKSSTVAAGDVSTLGSAGDMVQHLHDLVAHTKQFRGIMRQLVGKGIDQTTYGELVQAGVDGGGLEAAQSLLANPLDLRQVVSLQRQLSSAAGGLGGDSATHVYASAVGRDRGRVSDLNRLDRAYGRQQRSIAASTVRRVERDVHVNINLSGHLVGSETQLAKTVVKAIREATRSGAISKDALKV